MTRPDFHAHLTLDTPPVTDLDYTSQEHESDFISESPSDANSDAGFDGAATGDVEAVGLTAIEESPALEPVELERTGYDDAWSVTGDTDAEGDESDAGLAQSVGSLSLQDPLQDPDTTPRVVVRHHAGLRPRAWDPRRSASSPSRSPSRRPLRRMHPRIDPPQSTIPKSFYDYLYG